MENFETTVRQVLRYSVRWVLPTIFDMGTTRITVSQPCKPFEDMPASVLNSEQAEEMRFDDLPRMVQEANMESAASIAA